MRHGDCYVVDDSLLRAELEKQTRRVPFLGVQPTPLHCGVIIKGAHWLWPFAKVVRSISLGYILVPLSQIQHKIMKSALHKLAEEAERMHLAVINIHLARMLNRYARRT